MTGRLMRDGLVACLAMMRRAMPMRGRRELLLHQRPAAAVPHDLLVAHAMAGADRLPRKGGRRTSLVGRSMAGMRGPVMRPRGVMTRRTNVTARAPCVTAAHVH